MAEHTDAERIIGVYAKDGQKRARYTMEVTHRAVLILFEPEWRENLGSIPLESAIEDVVVALRTHLTERCL